MPVVNNIYENIGTDLRRSTNRFFGSISSAVRDQDRNLKGVGGCIR